MDEMTGEQLASMFSSLQMLDLLYVYQLLSLSPCQNYKKVIHELMGEQLASMFSCLQELDLLYVY
jgi:hypothetical protein